MRGMTVRGVLIDWISALVCDIITVSLISLTRVFYSVLEG